MTSLDGRTSPWFPIPPSGERHTIQLFCFPCAGGDAIAYRRWIAELGPEIEFVPVQLPGRGTRADEPPIARATEVVEHLREPLLARADGPIALFGHSLGALLAFELAHSLSALGDPPSALIICAFAAPHLRAKVPGAAMHELPDEDLIRYLCEIDAVPEEVLKIPQLFTNSLCTLRADLSIGENYDHVARPPLRMPILVLGGRDDPTVGDADLQAWRDLSEGETAVHTLPGHHFFLNQERDAVTGIIRSALLR